MKRALPLLLLLLLLAACGRKAEPSAPPPTPPSPPPTAAPTPSLEPKKGWWEDLTVDELPTEIQAPSLDSGAPCYLLAELPEADIALYGGSGAEPFHGVLLRRGTHLQYFDQSYGSASPFQFPLLHLSDFDGDGQEELGVSYRSAGAGSVTQDLHVYEWEDGWTEYAFSSEAYNSSINELLAFQNRGGLITLSYGNDVVEYRLGLDDQPDTGLKRDFSGFVFFYFEQDEIRASFGICLDFALPRQIAALTAEADYEDGGFTLRSIRLTSIGGV